MNRDSIILLPKVMSWFLSQPGLLFTGLSQYGCGQIFLPFPTHIVGNLPFAEISTLTCKGFFGFLCLCFTKAISSFLVLLSAASPLQRPFNQSLLFNFPDFSSYFTCSAVLLFSLPLSPCSLSDSAALLLVAGFQQCKLFPLDSLFL